jgi:hypothetical protein
MNKWAKLQSTISTQTELLKTNLKGFLDAPVIKKDSSVFSA